MAAAIPNSLRDQLITAFRYKIADKYGVTPFPHQAAWWAASDGAILLDVEVPPHEGMEVKLSDGTHQWRGLGIRDGGRARVIADLGAFKIGKSFSSALWVASFACIPNARVQLVGLEYDICAPEFEYLLEFLCSERGMGINPESVQNRPRDGRMWLEFDNGARFEAKSWERKDTMKGKEIDCYLYCEAYMLPGLECYTSFSQNLRARDGYAIFATTPDRPWVNDIHNAAHSGLPEFRAWHCTCSVHSSQNPYTFDKGAMERDKNLMTREKFAIHYEGKLGDFVGRVFQYQRGDRTFSPLTHPYLFRADGSFALPDGWTVEGACDTGTYTSAVLVAFSPDGEAFVLHEQPNYNYVASVPERDETITIPAWTKDLELKAAEFKMRPFFLADQNSQFKREFANYGIHLEANKMPLEARTEITREYFQNKRIWLAPHLKVLPFELENAAWPEETTAAGKFQRIKDRDHTLDCLEHILSKRPKGKWAQVEKEKGRWIDTFVQGARIKTGNHDPHL